MSDFDALTVHMTATGAAVVSHPGMCAAEAAARLRALADVMQAAHDAELTQVPPAGLTSEPGPDEMQPLHSDLSRLDRDRQLWTDGMGHVWDLSLTWADATGNTWTWTRRMDLGAPVMRMHGGGEEQPLDAIRGFAGPLTPVTGGGR
jgi:hypothetical protein